MKTIAQLKAEENNIQEEIRQAESQIRSAHAKLVNATREKVTGKALNDLVNAETILKAHAEALQQVRAEKIAEIEQAEKDAELKEAQERARKIKQLEAELNAAAREAGRQFAALE